MSDIIEQEAEGIHEEYKKVQLGPKELQIPESWSIKSLGETSQIEMGSSPKSEYYNEDGDGLPFFQGNADFGFRCPTVNTWCSKPNKIANKGDILISVRAPVGELNIADTKCCIGRGLAGISTKNSSRNFIYYLLHHERQRLQTYSQGSTFDSINSNILDSFPVQIPPEPEQSRIAVVLSTVDKEIQETTEIIETAEEVKQGLEQDLVLGHGLANEYQKIKLGPRTVEVPVEWEKSSFSNIATIEKGNTPKTSNDEYYGGDIVWVTPDDLSTLYDEGNGKYVADSRRKLTQAGLESTSVDIVAPDSVMFTSRSYGIGKTAICTVPAATNQGIIAFKPESEMRPEYLYHYLNWIMDYIISLSGVSTFPEVSKSDVDSIGVPVPTLEHQDRIVEILRQADEKIVREQEHKEKLQDLKRGLMQDLLTGKVRTPSDLLD